MSYTPKTFTIPELKGISATTIAEHLKLYEGYVKHANLILSELQSRNPDTDAYAMAELQRRFAFEFDGMRNHEYYFASLEGGATPLTDQALTDALCAQWGSVETWLAAFKTLAKTRGIGWAMLYYDQHTKRLLHAWVDEQHLGHLTGCVPVLALDMWEHSFVADYQPSGKATYIEDFFFNLNWNVIAENFKNATRA
ncbi:MAG: hypothetical protein RL150_745 [Candidatus Parcubacteria bacterium]|jgi:Fe-Mn family superoxide dismutase